jgi:RNA polymerase sigma-70 factor (ECF subfamily)
MVDEDDSERIVNCLSGDTAAFEPLVAKYQRVLFNVALRMVDDYEEARDITQSAFVKAFEHLASYDRRHKFFSWIYRIAVNESVNVLKRRRPHAPLDPQLATPVGPLDAVATSELSLRVRAALMDLPVEQREVLVLRHFAELSYSEMAAALQIPEKTVKSRLFEGRRRLADVLCGCEP